MPPKHKAKIDKAAAKKADLSPSPAKVSPAKRSVSKDPVVVDVPKPGKTPSKSPAAKSAVKSVGKSAEKSAVKSVDAKPAKSPEKSKLDTGKRVAPASSSVDPLPIKKTKTNENIVKVITKGGAAVDILVPNKEQYRVYQQNGKTYGATLNQSNLDHNNNKFYIIQVLFHEKENKFFFWSRWGRVGVPGQFALKGPWPKESALKEYNTKHYEKTGKGDYKQIEIKYDEEEEKKAAPKQPASSKPTKEVSSKMEVGLQKLISLIFDVTLMNNTMKQIGYDATKMPLGKLGETTIKQAYTVLTALIEAIKKTNKQAMKKLTSEFYTLIPHNFGFKNMMNFILDNEEKVKEKVKMLETISDLKITSKLLDEKVTEDTSILDQNYKKLGCDIKTVPETSAEYKLLQEYFNNTKGCYSKVTIGEIYAVNRPTEEKAFNDKIKNNMLLWHGSRVSNFVGILSQGLRIAPPQAPASGYLFGKGIYLADMAEKSINYCRSHGSDTALMLLIEGAIGDPNVLLSSNCSAKELMIANKKDSTKCHGSKAPPPETYTQLKDVIVPKGPVKPTGSGSHMGHNEFIVYNMNQAKIRYVIRMDMKGQ